MDIVIKDFMRTGQIGPIKLGDRKPTVREFLGNPQDQSHPGGDLEIWKYGPIEISFYKEGAIMFGVYFRSPGIGDKQVVISDYHMMASFNIDDLVGLLKHEGIGVRNNPQLTFGSQMCVVTEGGVQVLGDSESRAVKSIQYRG